MKHFPPSFAQQADGSGGHCLLVIAASSDAAIYGCFRSLAHKWRASLQAERLWIEHAVPISSGLTFDSPPDIVQRILNAERELILRIEIELGSLLVAFNRSGGAGPFRQSFFDEIRIERRYFDDESEPTIPQVLEQVRECLRIGAAVLSADAGELAEIPELPNTSIVSGPLPF